MRRGFGEGSLQVLRALVLAVFALALTVTRASFAGDRMREVTSWETCAGTLEACTAPGAPRSPSAPLNRTPSWEPLRDGVFELTWIASFAPEPGGRSHVVVPGEMNRYRTVLRCASSGEVARGEPTVRMRTELEVGPCASPLELAVEVSPGVAWRRWNVRAFVGPREELFELQRLGESAPLVLIGALVFFAIVQLVLALEPRGRTGALLTGALAFTSALRVYAVSDDWGLWIGPARAHLSVQLIYATPAAAILLAAAFYRWAAKLPATRLWVANVGLAAFVMAFAFVFTPATVQQHELLRSMQASIVGSVVFGFHAIVVLCRTVGPGDRTVVVAGTLVVGAGVAVDFLRVVASMTDWAGIGFAPIGFLFEILSQSLLVARRNARAHDAVDALALSLEEKNVALAETNRALEHEVEGHRRVAAELAISQQRLVLGENMATLGMLMADIAHDLRNPIHYVQTAADILEENAPLLPATTRAEVERKNAVLEASEWVRTGSGAMEAISRAMRNQARSGAELEIFALPEVTQEALLLCRSRTKLHRVEVDVDDAEAHLDPTAYGQLLMNLLSNAADALSEHAQSRAGFEGVVHVCITHHGDHVRVVVEDNGPGIPEAVAARILEPFFTTKPRGQGTGLGLAIVQRVVQAHRGTLTIGKSPTLGGACFEAVLRQGSS
jgi:signal transduction histidine kinase